MPACLYILGIVNSDFGAHRQSLMKSKQAASPLPLGAGGFFIIPTIVVFPQIHHLLLIEIDIPLIDPVLPRT